MAIQPLAAIHNKPYYLFNQGFWQWSKNNSSRL